MSESIATGIQRLNTDAVVTMFDLDLRSLGGGIFRFTSARLDGTSPEPIVWRGDTYLPLPISASGFDMSSSGQFPRPKIMVSNVLSTIKSEMLQYNNLIGATVTRWRTFRKHLDDGDDPDPDIFFPPDVFKIDRKSAETSSQIEFELATILDQEGTMLPRRQVLRNTCTHIYRVYDVALTEFDYSRATCPYAGTNYFDENGNAVTNPALDNPSKLLTTCCKKRFPNEALPTRAFPGVGRY